MLVLDGTLACAHWALRVTPDTMMTLSATDVGQPAYTEGAVLAGGARGLGGSRRCANEAELARCCFLVRAIGLCQSLWADL
jgi:hypothetical protein